MKLKRIGGFWLAVLICLNTISWAAAEPPAAALAFDGVDVVVTVDAGNVLREFNPRLLGGTNVAAWQRPGYFNSPNVRPLFTELNTGIVRLPGGSWGDAMFWNGNGVRGADGKVDPTKIGPDGFPAIDYTDYAPSFMLDEKTWKPRTDGWHGHVDVKFLHEFVRSIGAPEQMVIANAGTGRPVDAAEWVRWANKEMGYNVRWWEVGNELDGSWEAGHVQRDGTVMTAEAYAQKFKAFAEAMKAVDPTILVGGATSGTDDGGFSEVMLRDAGELVDFVSVHIYPGNPMLDDQEQIARIKSVSECAAQLKRWIAKYQPDRVGKIPLALTEWGLPSYRGQSELLCTLWASLFIHEAANSGYDVLNHWLCDEVVRHTNPGKWEDNTDWANGPYVRGPEYYALWLWNHYSGNRLVQSSQDGSELLHTIATRSDDSLYVTLVNTSREQEARATIKLANFEPGTDGEQAIVSHREYFRDYVAQKILWSTGARIEPLKVASQFQVTVPAFSIVAVRIPQQGAAVAQTARQQPPAEMGTPELRLLMPAEGFAEDRVEGWLIATEAGTDRPYRGELPSATLTVQGADKDKRAPLRMSESAARFFVVPATPGTVTVSAASGDLSTTATFTAKPSVPKPKVVWEFEEHELAADAGYARDFTLSSDASVRPNQRVARIDLANVTPDQEKRVLLRLEKMPPDEQVNRADIRGVFFDLQVSEDLVCDDPNARVEVIMQSPANWWMSLGSVPLAQAREWKTHTLDMKDPKHIEAIGFAHNVWFTIVSDKPVSGSIFIDRVGFMVR